MEYQGYKHKTTKDGRDMWYHNGRLTAQDKVPGNVQEHFKGTKTNVQAEKVEGSGLFGFTEGLQTNDATQEEINKQKKLAMDVLSSRFPDFNFDVDYQPSFLKEGRKIKPTYTIYVLSGDILEKTMRVADFDLNVISENMKALLSGWEATGRTRAPRRGEKLGAKSVGEGNIEKTFVKDIKVPRG
jgi:hypothetical protein